MVKSLWLKVEGWLLKTGNRKTGDGNKQVYVILQLCQKEYGSQLVFKSNKFNARHRNLQDEHLIFAYRVRWRRLQEICLHNKDPRTPPEDLGPKAMTPRSIRKQRSLQRKTGGSPCKSPRAGAEGWRVFVGDRRARAGRRGSCAKSPEMTLKKKVYTRTPPKRTAKVL